MGTIGENYLFPQPLGHLWGEGKFDEWDGMLKTVPSWTKNVHTFEMICVFVRSGSSSIFNKSIIPRYAFIIPAGSVQFLDGPALSP